MNRTTKRPVIGKYLDISSGHITKKDGELLGEAIITEPTTPFVVYKYDEGWFVHVPSDTNDFNENVFLATDAGYSDDFIKVVRKARAIRCWFIRIDADGTTYTDLPTFNW